MTLNEALADIETVSREWLQSTNVAGGDRMPDTQQAVRLLAMRTNTFGIATLCTATGAGPLLAPPPAVCRPADGSRTGSAYPPAGGRGSRTISTIQHVFGSFWFGAQPAPG